jgi:hypothetical protein
MHFHCPTRLTLSSPSFCSPRRRGGSLPALSLHTGGLPAPAGRDAATCRRLPFQHRLARVPPFPPTSLLGGCGGSGRGCAPPATAPLAPSAPPLLLNADVGAGRRAVGEVPSPLHLLFLPRSSVAVAVSGLPGEVGRRCWRLVVWATAAQAAGGHGC